MFRKAYPSDLTDTEWTFIKPLLPPESTIGHPKEVDFREIVNGIFYVQREGCTWRGLPGDFPPWQTVYKYLRHWQQLGIWQKIHDQLRTQVRQVAGKTGQASAAILDSQSVKTTEKRGRSTATMRAKRSKDANALPSSIPLDY
jgi:transposase